MIICEGCRVGTEMEVKRSPVQFLGCMMESQKQGSKVELGEEQGVLEGLCEKPRGKGARKIAKC